MSSIELDKDRNEFLLYILTALNIPIQSFMEALTYKDNCYERFVYRWAIQLFEKGKAKEESLRIILKGRNILLLRRDRLQNEQLQSKRLTALLQQLNFRLNYNLLTEEDRTQVTAKIKELTGEKQAEQIINEAMGENKHIIYEPENTNEEEEENEKIWQRIWRFLGLKRF